MDKKAFLAITLSLVVLFSWQMLVKKLYHTDNEIVTNMTADKTASQQAQSTLAEPFPPLLPKLENIKLDIFENDKLKIEFVNPGAKLYKVYLKDYKLNSGIYGGIFSKLFEDKIYTLQKSDTKLQFTANENGHLILQSLNFHNNSYFIELETVYTNETSSNWTFNDRIVLVTASHNNTNPQENSLFEVAFLGPEAKRMNPLGIKNRFIYSGELKSLGFRDRYSCIIISPQDGSKANAYIEKHNNSAEVGLDFNNIVVAANSRAVYKSIIYCGPQDANLLKQNKLGFEEIVYYGSFDFISVTLLAILHFFYQISHSWGAALILLSLFTFFALYPLTLKQMRSMKQMQELQPHIEALRKNYKDNPQRLNKEIMELYRKHKANPLGGCLPVILQIPIFFGLYQALSRSIVLKGSRFLWIKDLAEPDRLFMLPQSLPFIGQEVNLLPILMAIGMFVQQKVSLKAGAASSAAMEQQKMMVLIMPVMFGFIFYHFPSGLALYWFLNTLLSTISQWKILKSTAPITAN